ncbi:MAG TPA: hypothetical protein VGT78_07310 [Rhizomicrobium sp.]|nr:hypothetical protein [Rhizomicrobium sp.]
MKLASSTALRAAILCGAAIAVSACVYEPYHRGYGGYYEGGYGYGNSGYYADPCEQDRAYCGYPMYEGGIYIDGNWYEGRHRYRDQDGRREYYLHGSWYPAERTRDRGEGGDRGAYDRDRGEHMNGGDRGGDRGDWRNRDRNRDNDNDRDRHTRDNDHDND